MFLRLNDRASWEAARDDEARHGAGLREGEVVGDLTRSGAADDEGGGEEEGYEGGEGSGEATGEGAGAVTGMQNVGNPGASGHKPTGYCCTSSCR